MYVFFKRYPKKKFLIYQLLKWPWPSDFKNRCYNFLSQGALSIKNLSRLNDGSLICYCLKTKVSQKLQSIHRCCNLDFDMNHHEDTTCLGLRIFPRGISSKVWRWFDNVIGFKDDIQIQKFASFSVYRLLLWTSNH